MDLQHIYGSEVKPALLTLKPDAAITKNCLQLWHEHSTFVMCEGFAKNTNGICQTP